MMQDPKEDEHRTEDSHKAKEDDDENYPSLDGATVSAEGDEEDSTGVKATEGRHHLLIFKCQGAFF